LKNVNSPSETEKQSRIPILTKDFTLSESNLKGKKLLKLLCIENKPVFILEKYDSSFGSKTLNFLFFLQWILPSIFIWGLLIIISVIAPYSMWVAMFNSSFYATYCLPVLDLIPLLGIESEKLLKPNTISTYVSISIQFIPAFIFGLSIPLLVLITLLLTRLKVYIRAPKDELYSAGTFFSIIAIFCICIVLVCYLDPILGIEIIRKRINIPDIVLYNASFVFFSVIFRLAMIQFICIILGRAKFLK
jgi:hypothetical protein